jgi:sulfur carrier protein ThiS
VANSEEGAKSKPPRDVESDDGRCGNRLDVNDIVFAFNTTRERTHMKILVINNDGGGFADYVDVADGTTVAQLFERQIGSTKPSHYLIRVNRQPCPADQVLREGDRISITPTKIEGANS